MEHPDEQRERAVQLAQSLRNPLHASVGLAEVLLERASETDYELVRAIVQENRRMSAIVGELIESLAPTEGGPPTAGELAILVVDDSPVNQLLTASQLERLGHKAHVCSSGVDALEQLPTLRVDLILMDWHMPVMDGLETSRRIRQMEQAEGWTPLPIIALTARAMIGDRERCLEAGMSDFLSKPVSLDDLESTIDRWRDADAQPTIQPDTGSTAGAGSASEPEVSVLDASAIERLSDDLDDPRMVRELLRAYLDELPGRIEAMRAGSDNGDWDAVRRAAHTLRSTSSLIGASEIARHSGALESLIADDGDPAGALDIVDAITAVASDTTGAMETLCDSLPPS